MGKLIQELKRRNVFKVVAVYAAVSWLLLQVADTLFPAFDMPDASVRVLAVFLLFGFPVALILSWAFELTAEGIQKTASSNTEPTSPLQGKDYALVVLAIGLIFVVGIQQVLLFGGAGNRRAIDEAMSSADAGTLPSAESQATRIPDKSVAVLPFVAMSSGEDDGYFADGLTEELLNTLVQLSDLKVPGRTSSFYYKGRNEDLRDVGEALGVAHVLEGSVRRAGNQIRITAQLINTSDGFHLWSETFDRTLDDIFAIQDEIANEVTQALRVQLLGEEANTIREHGTDIPEAQQLYMIANAQFRELTLEGSMQANPQPYGRVRALYERAVELDPDYAEAWAGLVNILLQLSGPGLTDAGNILLTRAEGNRLAENALARAEAVAPNAPATLLAGAMVNERLSQVTPTPGNLYPDVPTIESIIADYERALDADPDNLDTLREFARMHLRNTLDLNAVLTLYNRIIELDPLAPELLIRARYLGFIDPIEAERQVRVVADLYPDSSWQREFVALELNKGHLHHAYLYMDENDLGPLIFVLISLGLDADYDAADYLIERGGAMTVLGQLLNPMINGDYEAALEYANSLLQSPDAPGASTKFIALNRLRRFDEAAAFLRSEQMPPTYRARLFLGAAMEFPIRSNVDYMDIAYVLRQTGDAELADAIHERVRENLLVLRQPPLSVSPPVARLLHEYDFMLYAAEGRVEEAITAMTAMVDEGWLWLQGPTNSLIDGSLTVAHTYDFEDNPALDSVRDDPRFVALLDQVKATLAAQKAELDAGLTIAGIED